MRAQQLKRKRITAAIERERRARKRKVVNRKEHKFH